MFGAYRTMLAVWVVAHHLVGIPAIGGYAVFAFFTLSGFLMTTVMHKTYGYDRHGAKNYAINRMLRLYPMYWVTALLSVISIAVIGEPFSSQYHSALRIPSSPQEVLTNGSMIYPTLFPYEYEPRLSPPTWALTLEIFFYACIAAGISKTVLRTYLWVALSMLYFAMTYWGGLDYAHRYGSIFAASLPFSLGALLYFKKEAFYQLLKRARFSHPMVVMAAYVANAFVFMLNAYYTPFDASKLINEIGIYTNIILSLAAIIALLYRGKEFFNRKTDKFLGDFSYPLYLLHWPCGLIAAFLIFSSPSHGFTYEGIIVFLVALPLSLLISFLLIKTVDERVELLRDRNKKHDAGAKTVE